ncbi:MAG: hypothetical protein BA863_16505 [Desulfovibrio sp. S3730MH75]|nr:MAG: hypothetical protein BA863_16505 [Desulfovibrio sp. S3730MH75]
MAEFKGNKFFVINREHLRESPPFCQGLACLALDYAEQHIPHNRYYVCNQDEPYADEVLRIILEGEDKKSA